MSPAAFGRCAPSLRVAALDGVALGTTWRVRYVERGYPADTLRTAIDRRLAAIVAEMSQWAPDSVLSGFNCAPAGSWTALPADFATVIAVALDIAARSDGAFDPTHGRAAALLGYGAERVDAPPSSATLVEAHARAGWQRIVFERGSRRLRQPGGLWLDLSGIAKGFAVDAVASLLAREGVEDALVEIGGELVGRGLKPDGQPWWVDLETPPGIALPPLRVALHDLAVATSGHYVRGAHTIDPRTGGRLQTEIASVSVLHESAMHADAWATALMVLGPDAGLALATQEDLAARFVTGNAELLSPRLAAMFAE